MKRASVTVSGIVQGVGFRYFIRHTAIKCGLRGEVKNMEDGTASIICEGEERSIEKLVNAIRKAERPVEVDDIQIEYSEPTGQGKNFKIVLGDICEEMMEGFGTGAVYLRDINKKQDVMIEKMDEMSEKQDVMIEKQDDTIKEIRTLSSNMHDMMDSRFQRLEDEITKIKAKLSI